MAPEIQAAFADESPEPDSHDREAVLDHIVEGERPYAGPAPQSMGGSASEKDNSRTCLGAMGIGDSRLKRFRRR
jgi:hypothetical protein